MGAQQISTIAQALAALRVKPSDAFTAQLLGAAGRLLPSFEPEGLGMLAFAVVELGAHPPAPWRRAFLAAAAHALPRCSSHNLASFVVLLARWQLDPGRAWWGRFFAATGAAMAAGAYSPQVLLGCDLSAGRKHSVPGVAAGSPSLLNPSLPPSPPRP
jgi:hypothetical protein